MIKSPTLNLSPDELRTVGEGSARERLDGMLTLLARRGGQDLHLSAGAPPSMRLHGELVRLPLTPLTPEAVQAEMLALLTEAQKQTFVRDLELDFAIGVPGVGRFRCNLYRQRGSLSFTARHLREHVPGADELRLPRLCHEVALKTQGLVLITGPTVTGSRRRWRR
jgi:Tfp pilus assembly pilus retraction ATPase PilT